MACETGEFLIRDQGRLSHSALVEWVWHNFPNVALHFHKVRDKVEAWPLVFVRMYALEFGDATISL